MNSPRDRTCYCCTGQGFQICYDTDSDHHPDCIGECDLCPIPVPVSKQVECGLCEGTGMITKEQLRRHVVAYMDPLKACEEIERLKLNG